MYLFRNSTGRKAGGPKEKLLRIMRLTAILLSTTCFFANAEEGSGQKLSLSGRNLTLQEVFAQIKKNTGYVFFYDEAHLKKAHRVNIDMKNAELKDVLDWCFRDQPLTYSIVGTTVVVKNKATGEERTIDLEHAELLLESPPPSVNVTGKVVLETGAPAVGVSVIVKGTALGTTSNEKGEFSLSSIDENATLVISGVNIQVSEVKVGGRNALGTIILKIKIDETFAEVVVVNTGFQTISKERITGAYGQVNDKILDKRPTNNIATALNGQIAGLVADPTTGFIIRGRSTLSNNVNDRLPLLVVDGFPIEGGFETINPNDVLKVDVLKDAAATSIYGARAANGVIVVTTKGMGKKGRMNVNYNGFVSIGSKMDLEYYMNMVESRKQIELDDYFYNTFKGTTNIRDPWTNTTFRGRYGSYFTLLAERDKGNITQEYFDAERTKMLNSTYVHDWEDYILQNSVAQQHNLVISGAGEKNSYKFSFLYDNDKTYLQNNNQNRYMLGFSNIYNISPNIRYTFNANITMYDQQNNAVNLSYAKSATAPWTRMYDENGNYSRHIHAYYEPRAMEWETRLPFSMRYNYLEESHLRDNRINGDDLRLQNEFDIKIGRDFRIKPMFQYEYSNNENISIYNPRSQAVRNAANIIGSVDPANSDRFVSQLPNGGFYRYNSGFQRNSFKLRLQADYNKTIGTKHEIAAVAGGELISSTLEQDAQDLKYGYIDEVLNYALFDYNVNRNNIFGENIASAPPTYENATIATPTSFSRQATTYNERFTAGYANASYTYNRKYTISGSLRTDASNYISETNRERFSPFYSVGLRWNMKAEKFLAGVNWLDRLALRATYGSTGNAAGKSNLLPFSVFQTQAPTGETGNYPGGVVNGRQNDLLTWEKTYSTNIGTDFAMFRGKLFGSLEFYNRLSEDLLTLVQTSNVIWSTTSQTINAAKVRNQGFEITLGSNINFGKNFNWQSSVVFDNNDNEVLEYNFLSTYLLNYVGSGTFVAGLPTDRIIAVKVVGTAPGGYYIQEKKNGELVPVLNSSYMFGGVNSIGSTIPGTNIKEDDRVYYIGRSTPPQTLGFTNTFSWKGLSLMTVMTGRFGHLIRRSDEGLAFGQGIMSYSATGVAALMESPKVATTETGIPMITVQNFNAWGTNNSLRTFYGDIGYEKASFIRFNEVYLGYDFPESIATSTRNIFKSATIYTQVRNLGIIWTNNESNIDPEYIPGTIKPIRTFTFGVRLGF
jgi:TonB-linked SusC/RagA family outer membrane protein